MSGGFFPPVSKAVCLHSFAFVEFETVKDATDALESLNNTDIEGRAIRLEYSQNSGRGDGGRGNSGRCCCQQRRFSQTGCITGPDMMKSCHPEPL